MAEDKKSRVNSSNAQDLEKAKEQFDQFDQSIKDMTLDRMNMAPKQETEPQTRLSSNELRKIPDHYLKPKRTVASREKFNERFRDDYNYMKVYVPFIAEHSELRGEAIEMWTKCFPGMPAEEWSVPTNVPVWGPRYLAEEIKKRCYHRLKMENTTIEQSGMGAIYGQMAIDSTVQRLDARPVNATRKSVFMGADGS